MKISDSISPISSTNKESLLSNDENKLLDNNFESILQKKKDELNLEENDRDSLVKNILSLLQTGFTEEELKRIEELLNKLEELSKNQTTTNKSSQNNLIDDIETSLIEAQEKVTGRSIQETDEKMNSILPFKENLETKIDALKQSINTIKNSSSLKDNHLLSVSVSEQLILIEQLKQKK